MIGVDDAGLGLVDMCTDHSVPHHEVYLPPGAAFSFDLTIPSKRLPKTCRQAGKEIRVVLCYELGEKRLTHSNAATLAMK